jgi:hypothetical protein
VADGKKRRKKTLPVYSPSAVSKGLQEVPKAIGKLFADDGANRRPIFSFALVDRDTKYDWGWHLLDDAGARSLVEFILQISQLTWNEIRSMTGSGNKAQHRKHHDQGISTLVTEAQECLSGPRYEEMGSEVFRFSLSPLCRLWGFEHRGTFYVVWWDPEHKVYPV